MKPIRSDRNVRLFSRKFDINANYIYRGLILGEVIEMNIDDGLGCSLLDFYREMDLRGALDSEKQAELYRLERGAVGEKLVVDYLEEFGPDDWLTLTNLWLYEYGLFEVDCLLLTETAIYVFEIKNYNGDFKYANSQCYFSDDVIGHNPISQIQRCKVNLQNILLQAGIRVPVHALLVFTGDHADIDIQDYIEDLTVLTINQLRKRIYSIAEDEQIKRGRGEHRLNHDKILRVLERGKRPSPYQPKPLTPTDQSRLRKGIKCAKCGHFDLDSTRSYLVCSCGMHEPREMAIVRTICEYGVLNFDKELVPSEVVSLFNNIVSVKTIKRYLAKYFEPANARYRTTYLNSATTFDKLFHQFEFKASRYFKF